MKFMSYWAICIALAGWAALEKLVATVQGKSFMWFWILIGSSFFFLLCAYGEMRTNRTSPTNPF